MLPVLQTTDYNWILLYVPYPVFAFILIFIFLNIAKIERWSADVAAIFSRVSSRLERASVARDIQGRISEFRRRPDYKETLPYGIRVKWEKGETISELKDGDVLVIMENHRSQTRNFVTALTAYMAIGAIPSARPYCPLKVVHAVELVTEQVVLLDERTDAFPIFRDEVLSPEKAKDPELSTLVNKLQAFEDKGIFSRVFLRELVRYGNELKGAVPQDSDWKPIDNLIDMLHRLVTKPPGEDTLGPFSVDSQHMKFTMVLVAKFWTLVTRGIDAHIEYAKGQVRRGFTRSYVWAWGGRDEDGKRLVSKMVNSGDFQLEVEETYRVGKGGKFNYIAALHSLRSFSEPMSKGSAEENKAKGTVITLGTGRRALVSAIQGLDKSVKFFDESEIGRALLDADPDFSTKAYGFSNLKTFLAAYPDVVIRTSSSRGSQYVYEVVIDRIDQTDSAQDSEV